MDHLNISFKKKDFRIIKCPINEVTSLIGHVMLQKSFLCTFRFNLTTISKLIYFNCTKLGFNGRPRPHWIRRWKHFFIWVRFWPDICGIVKMLFFDYYFEVLKSLKKYKKHSAISQMSGQKRTCMKVFLRLDLVWSWLSIEQKFS